jgi:hypothetical protein
VRASLAFHSLSMHGIHVVATLVFSAYGYIHAAWRVGYHDSLTIQDDSLSTYGCIHAASRVGQLPPLVRVGQLLAFVHL